MKYRNFLMIFALVFATRFGYFLYSRPFRAEADGRYGRMFEMETTADRLARYGRIDDVFGSGTGPSAHVAPLYAGYLAVLDQMSGFDVGWFRYWQGIGSILATSLFAALLPGFGTRAGLRSGAGLGAAVLVALSPFGLWMEIRGDWETAFLPLSLLGIAWTLMTLQDRGWADARFSVLTGLLFGLSGLLSPVVLLAGMAGLAGQWVEGRAKRLQVFRAGLIVASVCALTITPWIYRNYRCFGVFVPIRDNFGIELAVGNNPQSDGTTFGGGLAVHPLTSESELARLREMGEVRYNKAKQAEASAWIAANPKRFGRLTAVRWLHYWFPHDKAMLAPLPSLPNKKGMLWPGLPIPVQALAIGSITGLGLVGLAWLFVTRHPYRMLFLALIVAPSIPYLITHVSYRYRYPINGFVYLLGCECVARALAGHRKPDQT